MDSKIVPFAMEVAEMASQTTSRIIKNKNHQHSGPSVIYLYCCFDFHLNYLLEFQQQNILWKGKSLNYVLITLSKGSKVYRQSVLFEVNECRKVHFNQRQQEVLPRFLT